MSYLEFLHLLSPYHSEAEQRFRSIQAKLVWYFTRNNCPDPIDCAAVTIDRVVKSTVPDGLRNIEGWIFQFAKNIKHETLRRTPMVALEVARMPEEDHSDEAAERASAVMHSCLERLADSDRQLLVKYFMKPEGVSRSQHRATIAQELGITVNALRIRVTRIRLLLDKYRRKLQNSL